MQDLLNPAVKDQVVFDTPDRQYRDGERSSIWSMMQKAMSLTEISATSPIFSQEIYTESKQDELTIQFDGNEIVYPRNEWYKIRLAYAMSIHKSQGKLSFL